MKDELDQWFDFLCARKEESSPPANIMIGYAYGFAEAMLLADCEEPAREKMDLLIRRPRNSRVAQIFPDVGELFGQSLVVRHWSRPGE